MNCCPPRSPGREEEPSGHGTAMQANPGEHAQHDLELPAREPCRAVDTDSAAGPRPWPVPACTAPSAPSSSLPPSGHICRARMDKAPRQRAVRPPAARQGSGGSPASTEPPLLPPSMTSVSPAPARSGPAARDGGCWPGGPGRTSDITTSTSSAASESGAWRGSRKPDSGCPPHACAVGAYAPRARDSGKPGGHGHVMRWVGNRGPFACPRGNYVPTGICRFGVILTR